MVGEKILPGEVRAVARWRIVSISSWAPTTLGNSAPGTGIAALSPAVDRRYDSISRAFWELVRAPVAA
jgi:hypothetical protein